jgi:hypothetical protein
LFGPLLSLQVAHFRLGHELSLIAAAIAAVPALAANPQTAPLTCTLNQQGDVVTCGGELAGLGNVDFIDVVVDLDAGCATRGNESEPPGHFQVVDEDIPVDQNGRATFSTEVAPDCPPGLNEVFGDFATITVFEANTDNVLFVSDPIPIT